MKVLSQQTTPIKPPSIETHNSSAARPSTQRTIKSFFTRSPASATPTPKANVVPKSGDNLTASYTVNPREKLSIKKATHKTKIPTPSSDTISPISSQEFSREELTIRSDDIENLELSTGGEKRDDLGGLVDSTSRRARSTPNYSEDQSDSEEEFTPRVSQKLKRRPRRPKISDDEDDDDDDEFSVKPSEAINEDDDEIDNFVDEDESDVPSRKRKRPSSNLASSKKKRLNKGTTSNESKNSPDHEESEIPEVSTAQQWKYDPENTACLGTKSTGVPKKTQITKKNWKEKAHKTEPEKRYPWLAQLRDIDQNPIDHPDYDPTTVYIPPYAWNKFSAFEHQYWTIKQKFWNTVVFFKKGKFYELYENDATIGHQLFDLKLTDRVNMRMVGVPESSLDHWANQFVAKGYKIARVDQCESALGKEMREAESGTKPKKPVDKIIKRELACVLTGGTLVEGSMLQDDMAIFCVAIKEDNSGEFPEFGVAIVDTATGQFFVSEFVDDHNLTKFETFVAQTRPQELLLEKGSISTKTLRILKNNTNPTTIWNYLKPNTEFWTADTTRRELGCSGYFVNEQGEEVWPETLQEVKDQNLLMSAFGALVQYLRSLKLEHSLLTQKSITTYNPIQKGTTLVLDGQTLINLEIFANTYDGSQASTLFSLINRCVTPFGKRMLRQWVCHPLADPSKINWRLDAVELLLKDRNLTDTFSECMSGLPDLERLISRIHAGSCRPEDFVKVLTAFDQIEYTMSLLKSHKKGEGYISSLLNSMPELGEKLEWWRNAFDYSKAKEQKLLLPTEGIEEEFDSSQMRISEIEDKLALLLKNKQKELGGSTKIGYKNIGKEVYQLEVPASIKVPKDWQVMSSAAKFKRYYFSDLRQLIRQLQETQETHTQIIKQVASRFYARFDLDYSIWLQVIKVIGQLDCLVSLSAASAALGEPSCRPQFVDSERSVIQFNELRHPCIIPHVTDFIPNDIQLGGETANITLLTGANAAGKSTILRMTCIAVIMAQIGCHVPAISATLTPVDRIMSRLGANDNIFAAQSTFFVELLETKKILSEATPRSLVILDELGRGTSSYDGVAVAQSVLHHISTQIGCVGFFATHYHSLATEFAGHPEIVPKRMQIHVDKDNRRVTFLYKLEKGVAEGSFGMHCAAMCGIPSKIIDRAEVAALKWEHTSRLKESLENAKNSCYLPLGIQSDVSWALKDEKEGEYLNERGLKVLLKTIQSL
ncbi:DNA mismatch repair protein [Podosphaera aphanis]|nr:DNA mismatch repair protein [Podosphaera aphanis]